MGDLAFGRSFDALETGKSRFFMDLIRGNGVMMGLFLTTPWVMTTLLRLPLPPSINPVVKLLKSSSDLVEARKRYKSAEPDVMSHILDAGTFYSDKAREDMLVGGDARLLVIAGSDTTAAALIFLNYYRHATRPWRSNCAPSSPSTTSATTRVSQ